MATVPIYTRTGEKAGEVELAADIFGRTPNTALMHQAVVTTLANMRQGTADTKTRGEVKHTTRKAWRQKGTGRARQGMRSAPHWKGGGVVFGPHPRDYSLAFPKKMRRSALLSALSAKAADEAIVVVEDFGLTAPKTKDAATTLRALGLDEAKLLVVIDSPNPVVELSFRNLPRVLVATSETVGTYDILSADRILFTRAGLDRLQEVKQQPVGIARWMEKQGGEA